MKSQLILIALICLISFNGILASNLNRKSHKKAKKWAEKVNCVCSSVSACDKNKFDLSVGREDGKGESNNCSCNKAKRCECAANSSSGVLESDRKTACQCLVNCQQSNGAKVVEGLKQAGGAAVDAVKSGLSSAGQAVKDGANALADGAKDAGKALADGAKSAGKALVAGASDAVDAAAQLGNKAVDATKDALDTCKCSGQDFTKVAKNSSPEQHKVSSVMRIRNTPCECQEECSCPQLTILKRRFNKLNKLHQTTKAQRLLDSLRSSYNGTFKNGDKCTCDENMVNKAKAALASGVQGAKELANKAGAAVADGAKAVADGAKDLANKAGTAVKDGAKAVAAGAKDLANKAGAALSNTADAAKQLAGKAADAAGKAVDAVADKAKAVKDAAGNAIKGAVGAVGEMLAGECLPDGKGYHPQEGKPDAPYISTGRQARSNGLCEVEEKCNCEFGKQLELKVNSTYAESKRACTCEISSATQLINKGKNFLSWGKRLSKRQMGAVKAYCSSLQKDQCLNGCSFSEQKQQCQASKATLRLAKSRSSKKIQMKRDFNRFKQVPLDFQ